VHSSPHNTQTRKTLLPYTIFLFTSFLFFSNTEKKKLKKDTIDKISYQESSQGDGDETPIPRGGDAAHSTRTTHKKKRRTRDSDRTFFPFKIIGSERASHTLALSKSNRKSRTHSDHARKGVEKSRLFVPRTPVCLPLFCQKLRHHQLRESQKICSQVRMPSLLATVTAASASCS